MDLAEALVAGIAAGLFCVIAHPIGRVLKVPEKHRGLMFGLAAGLSVVAGGAARTIGLTDWLNLRLGLKTQLDIDADCMGKDLMHDRRFDALVKGKSPGEAREITSSLSHEGIPRLTPDKVLLWARLNSRMASASPAFCSARWKGNLQPNLFADAFGRLSAEERAQWLEISTQAMRLSLDGAPVRAVPPNTLSTGFDAVFTALGPEAADRARQDVVRKDLSDERACELFRITFDGAQQLSGDIRDDFLRGLAQL